MTTKPLVDGEERPGGRWCAAHGRWHGNLYICPEYPEALKARIRTHGEEFRANLGDPEWVDRQVADGVPRSVINVFKLFTGTK